MSSDMVGETQPEVKECKYCGQVKHMVLLTADCIDGSKFNDEGCLQCISHFYPEAFI
jgi:hypothetical protein